MRSTPGVAPLFVRRPALICDPAPALLSSDPWTASFFKVSKFCWTESPHHLIRARHGSLSHRGRIERYGASKDASPAVTGAANTRDTHPVANKPIDELARDSAESAMGVLTGIMEDSLAEDRDRIRAAEAVLDRGYGKAAQAIIQVPASRKQAALLAGMSDEALVAVIEAKVLPRLTPAQPMVTVPLDELMPVDLDAFPTRIARVINKIARPSRRNSRHGPSDLHGDESAPSDTDEFVFIDPLME